MSNHTEVTRKSMERQINKTQMFSELSTVY